MDLGSRLCMSIAGWSYPMGRQDLDIAVLLSRVVNMTRGKGEKPYAPEWPWSAGPSPEDVTADERAALKSQLKARSAFGQKRE